MEILFLPLEQCPACFKALSFEDFKKEKMDTFTGEQIIMLLSCSKCKYEAVAL